MTKNQAVRLTVIISSLAKAQADMVRLQDSAAASVVLYWEDQLEENLQKVQGLEVELKEES